jgi:hypothetical protein
MTTRGAEYSFRSFTERHPGAGKEAALETGVTVRITDPAPAR